jgi:hypothetical protein
MGILSHMAGDSEAVSNKDAGSRPRSPRRAARDGLSRFSTSVSSPRA